MSKSQKYQIILVILIIAALALRLGLALVNREANDDHMEVIRIIMTTGQIPVMYECRECFHPKLFYVIAAGLLKVLPVLELNTQIVFVQLLNFVVGVATLAVVYKFIKEYPSVNETLKLVVFGFVALNPKLIAIHSQASNDTFVIFFGIVALYLTYHFFKTPGRKLFAGIVLVLLLAVSTKVMGWITFAAIFMAFLLAILMGNGNRKNMTVYALLILVTVIVFSILNPLSQMVTNYQKFGTPFANTRSPLPLPSVFHQTFKYKEHYFRPGIVSIHDGFFTFKFADLLNFPLITNEPDQFPPHRTSFWTMLYADTHSLHFQNWPPSWQTKADENFTTSRGIFVLALLPTLILIAGFLREIWDLLKALMKWNKSKIHSMSNGLFLVAFVGNLAFLMSAALLFRDFAFIKLIYIFPALLAFAWLFLRGMEVVWMPMQTRPGLQILLVGWMSLLFGFYIWDVLSLIFQLYSTNIYPT